MPGFGRPPACRPTRRLRAYGIRPSFSWREIIAQPRGTGHARSVSGLGGEQLQPHTPLVAFAAIADGHDLGGEDAVVAGHDAERDSGLDDAGKQYGRLVVL